MIGYGLRQAICMLRKNKHHHREL